MTITNHFIRVHRLKYGLNYFNGNKKMLTFKRVISIILIWIRVMKDCLNKMLDLLATQTTRRNIDIIYNMTYINMKWHTVIIYSWAVVVKPLNEFSVEHFVADFLRRRKLDKRLFFFIDLQTALRHCLAAK